jgi:hypothetical protein
MKDQEKDTTVEATNAQGEQRKPYVAPKLRRLGSVRELTFGSHGAMPDAATPMFMM